MTAKKRNDARALAAYTDVHTGLCIALRGLIELTKQNPDDLTEHAPLYTATQAAAKSAVRSARWARTRVTAQIDAHIEGDMDAEDLAKAYMDAKFGNEGEVP